MGKLLTIDYSTTSTGFAIFDINSKTLLDYGFIKPRKLKKTGNTLIDTLAKLKDISQQINDLIKSSKPDKIIIEEINRGKNRLGQKTLDGGHFVLYSEIGDEYLKRVRLIDSDGAIGWRTRLGLRLSEMDKKVNAEHKRINKKLKPKDHLVIYTKKHLAARYVNSQLGTRFDVDLNPHDNDVVDAIGLGLSELLTLA